MRRVGDLVERGPGLAREGERQAELLAHCGIDRDHRYDAHRRARRKAAQRLRPQLGPAPALAALEGGEPVDLVEIVVGTRVTRIALARRRPVGPEMRTIVFRAGDQDHATQRARRPIDRRDGVDEHVAVRSDVRCIARSGAGRRLKRCVENVRDVLQSGKLFRHALGVEEIDSDVAVARRGIGGPTRQADDGPVALPEQPRDDVAPDHTERADDDGLDRDESFDLGAVLGERETAELGAIDAALRRVADGSYGLCVDCGTQIPAARLHAQPTAERCVGCQARVE